MFPPVGWHTTLECNCCHTGSVYQGLPSECVNCHLDDYNATAEPNHAQAGFPTTCELCHTPTSWDEGQFDHPYQLVGVHATLDCLDCHAGGYQGTPTECVGCHQDDYNGSQNPNHPAAGFPTTCELCHTPTSWDEGQFDHPYQLVGVHATLDCASCHAGGVYQGTPTDCVGCHRDDYDGSQNPNHAAAGFPTTCDSCHQQTDPDWHQATYPHTVFPLVGSHTTLECNSCHTGSVYQGLPSECVNCHLDDYNAPADPAANSHSASVGSRFPAHAA